MEGRGNLFLSGSLAARCQCPGPWICHCLLRCSTNGVYVGLDHPNSWLLFTPVAYPALRANSPFPPTGETEAQTGLIKISQNIRILSQELLTPTAATARHHRPPHPRELLKLPELREGQQLGQVTGTTGSG
ncbi:hypothetical protein DR999_PMT17901 [Platysternon megacephalum]|uniref:Uncharacterized protein n=1 Tax=Platysternon megacephalum TaxID=55544 RepID=A0A4D9DQM8_9SAUR|nr:hypothetical protein DR999_PMT17901 [Platysternon megacephalum]